MPTKMSDFPKALEFLGIQPDLKLDHRFKAEILIHTLTTPQRAKLVLLHSVLLIRQKTEENKT